MKLRNKEKKITSHLAEYLVEIGEYFSNIKKELLQKDALHKSKGMAKNMRMSLRFQIKNSLLKTLRILI